MEHCEFENLIAISIKDALDYSSNSVAIKHILNKKTGNIMALALDHGSVYEPKVTPFSTFIHVIDGIAEVECNHVNIYMQHNDSMIIPGHTAYTLKANQQFKMLSIILKSGYDALEP